MAYKAFTVFIQCDQKSGKANDKRRNWGWFTIWFADSWVYHMTGNHGFAIKHTLGFPADFRLISTIHGQSALFNRGGVPVSEPTMKKWINNHEREDSITTFELFCTGVCLIHILLFGWLLHNVDETSAIVTATALSAQFWVSTAT